MSLGFPPHGPFQLGVGGAQLVFVGPVIAPQTVGGRSLLNLLNHAKVGRKREDFGFVQVGDGRKVHAAVPVFGVETHPKVFHFVAGARHQGLRPLGQRVQRCHAQART